MLFKKEIKFNFKLKIYPIDVKFEKLFVNYFLGGFESVYQIFTIPNIFF